MTAFKLLFTLLSVVACATATSVVPRQSKSMKCDGSGCAKALGAIAPAVGKCVSAGADLANATADPLKKASETVDCVGSIVAASLGVPPACNNCVQALNSGARIGGDDD